MVTMDEDMRLRREVVNLYINWRYNKKEAFPVSSKMSIAEYISRYGEIASGCQIEDVYVKLIGNHVLYFMFFWLLYFPV